MKNQKFIRQFVVPSTSLYVGDRKVSPVLALRLAKLGAAIGQTIRHDSEDGIVRIVERPWMASVLDEAVLHVERSYVAMAEEVSLSEDIARA